MKNTENKTENKLTTVKTIYARAAVLLLALNFCVTGYCFMKMNNIMEERLAGAEATTTYSAPTGTPTGAPQDSTPKTRESNN